MPIHHRTCNLCEAMCGLEIHHEDQRILSIRGDSKDPLSRGHICPKGVALADLHTDADRLRSPMRRSATGDWVPVPWAEALDAVAERLRDIQRSHGKDSVAVYLGNPNAHNYANLLFGRSLLRALGTRSRFSATSVDQLPHHLAAQLLFGHQLLLPVPDLDRTSFVLLLGSNPLVSNGSMMTAPGMRRRLAELRQRGGELVVVDPRRTETARVADQHLFVRPGSDVFLLAAILHTLFARDFVQWDRLEPIIDGGERLRSAVAPFSPRRAAEETGIGATTIEDLARRFAAAPAAVCHGRLGTSVQPHGALCQWLVQALNLATGNLDRPGGAMFARPAVDLPAITSRGHIGRWQSRVRGLPEFSGELPVATLAEEILTPGDGRIRALLTVAGNPVLSTPNGRQLDRALGSLDFLVSIDLYLNETTRHAHFVLPPTSPLERDHFDLVFNNLAVRNVARYSTPLFEPPADARHDWQIFAGLERRLARGSLPRRLRRAAERSLGPRRQLDLLLRRGPYGAGLAPFGRGLSLRRLERSPHGVDLGPLEPCLPDRLFTAGKRIDVAPEMLAAGLARLAEGDTASPSQADALLLVGRRHVRSNNSWMHNVPRLMRGRERCTLLLHPADAEARGIADGQAVTVRSRVGEVTATAEVSAEISRGAVSLPHGWGHDRPGIRAAEATRHPGASLNDLTDELLVDPLCGNAALSGVPVTVEPCAPPPGGGATSQGTNAARSAEA